MAIAYIQCPVKQTIDEDLIWWCKACLLNGQIYFLLYFQLYSSYITLGGSELVSLDLSGDMVGDGKVGGATGMREAGILAAQVPVVALSKSPPSAGTKSASST